MDFSKLNIEFNNIQNIIEKYNKMIIDIKQKIKNNNKDITKYENKIKNTKIVIEKDAYKNIIRTLKNENDFLEILLREQENKIFDKSGKDDIVR